MVKDNAPSENNTRKPRSFPFIFIAAFVLVLLALLILPHDAMAKAPSLKQWVYTNEPFTFNGNTYYAYLSNDESTVLIKGNETSIALPFKQCSEQNFILFCYMNVSDNDFKHIKYDTNGQQIHGFYVTLNLTGPILDIKNELDKSSVDVNDIISGRVTVTNNGNRISGSTGDSIIINDSAVFTSCGSCNATSPQKVSAYLGDIDVNSLKVINYQIKVLNPEDFNIYSNISYSYEGKNYTRFQKLATVKVHSPYSIKWKQSQGSVLIGSEISGSVNITNTGNLPITIGMSYDTTTGYDVQGNLFSGLAQNGLTLKPGESMVYDYKTRSTEKGTNNIQVNMTITRSDGSYDYHKKLTQTFTSSNLKIIGKSGKSGAVGGDSDSYYLTIQNNAKQSFKNIRVYAKGFFNSNKTLENIDPGQAINVFSDSLTYPKVNHKTEAKENITVFYDTAYGTQYNETVTTSTSLYPLNESYQLIRDISPKVPANGEKFTVKVYGQKLVNSKIQVNNVHDDIVGAKLSNGLNQGQASLTNTKQLLYSYTAVRNGQYLLINSSARLQFAGNYASVYNILEDGTKPSSGSTNEGFGNTSSTNESSGSTDNVKSGKSGTVVGNSSKSKGGIFVAIARFFSRLFGG